MVQDTGQLLFHIRNGRGWILYMKMETDDMSGGGGDLEWIEYACSSRAR